MKIIFGFFLAMLTFTVANAQKVIVKGRNPTPQKRETAQTMYSMEQLTGKWQEVKRGSLTGGDRVDFTDSLQLNFNKRDSVIVRDGISFSHKGHASVDNGNKLAIAGDNYSIRSLSKNILIVNDGEYIREFAKRKTFYYENMGKIIILKDNISEPISAEGKKLLGKWHVYRTQASPGESQDSAIIKTIKFVQVANNNSATGEITFTKNAVTQTIPLEANIEKGMIRLVTNTQTWSLQTYKADGKEFIFGNPGGLVYFSKKL